MELEKLIRLFVYIARDAVGSYVGLTASAGIKVMIVVNECRAAAGVASGIAVVLVVVTVASVKTRR